MNVCVFCLFLFDLYPFFFFHLFSNCLIQYAHFFVLQDAKHYGLSKMLWSFTIDEEFTRLIKQNFIRNDNTISPQRHTEIMLCYTRWLWQSEGCTFSWCNWFDTVLDKHKLNDQIFFLSFFFLFCFLFAWTLNQPF
jgi:hypothetical protein